MSAYPCFSPDLVIEVTTACDRQCAGCYAPNVVGSPQDLRKRPELFIKPEQLKNSLEPLKDKNVRSIAIRGGEPTIHPQLEDVLAIVHSFAREVYLETHGKWLLNPVRAAKLETMSRLGTVVKLSHDPMHDSSEPELRQMISVIEKYKIKYLVAITARNFLHFVEIRNRIAFIVSENIVFQLLAINDGELIQPRLGVVTKDGLRKLRPTSKLQVARQTEASI